MLLAKKLQLPTVTTVLLLAGSCHAQSMRVWTDSAGRQVAAVLVESSMDTVTLRFQSGREKVVPRQNLSIDDDSYLRSKARVLLVSTTPTADQEGAALAQDSDHELIQSMRRFEQSKREVRTTVTMSRTVTSYRTVCEEKPYTVSVPKTVWECVRVRRRWVWRAKTVCVQVTRMQVTERQVPYQQTQEYSEESIRTNYVPYSDDPEDVSLFIEKVEPIDLGPLPASAGPTAKRISRVLTDSSEHQYRYLPPAIDSEDAERVNGNTEWVAVPGVPNRLMQALVVAKPIGNDVGVVLKVYQIEDTADTANLQRSNYIPWDQALEEFRQSVLDGLKAGLNDPKL